MESSAPSADPIAIANETNDNKPTAVLRETDDKLDATEKYDVTVVALNGDCVLQVEADDKYTVGRLKQAIAHVSNVPIVGQQLACSGMELCDEAQLLKAIASELQVRVTLTQASPWEDEEIKQLRAELEATYPAGAPYDYDKFREILKRMPLYEEDKAKVFGIHEPQSSMLIGLVGTDLNGFIAAIMDIIREFAPALQQQLVLPAVCEGLTWDGDWSWIMSNEAIAMAVLERDGEVLEFAPEEVKGNRSLVMAAVKQNGMAYQHASEKMKRDHAVVMEAVQRHPMALAYAPEEKKSDKTIAMAALHNSGAALRFVSDTLKNDEQIVLAAVEVWEEKRARTGQGDPFLETVMWNELSEDMKRNDRVRKAVGLNAST